MIMNVHSKESPGHEKVQISLTNSTKTVKKSNMRGTMQCIIITIRVSIREGRRGVTTFGAFKTVTTTTFTIRL